MKKLILISALSLNLLFLTGCETTSSQPYTASTENVLKFQSHLKDSESGVTLGEFTENSDIGSLTCRLNGPVDVSPGKTKAEYIRGAMQTELFMAQVYDANSDVKITGNLDSLTFSSVSPASWEIGFTVDSNKSEGYSVTTNYPFKTSFSAYTACKNVSDAFGPAIQALINDIVSHKEFSSLIGE